jgi:hypothetical protein
MAFSLFSNYELAKFARKESIRYLPRFFRQLWDVKGLAVKSMCITYTTEKSMYRRKSNTWTVSHTSSGGHSRLDNILPRQSIVNQETSSVCLSSGGRVGKTTGLNKTALRLGLLSDECGIAFQGAGLSRAVLARRNS